jgi:hypothetical protein
MNREKLTRIPAELKAVYSAAFPTYRGRLFRLTVTDRPQNVKSYWDGGSRDYYAFVRLADGAVLPMPAQSAFDKQLAGADAAPMRPGFALVERSIFCGKDRGLTLILHPADLRPDMLPAAPAAVEA